MRSCPRVAPSPAAVDERVTPTALEWIGRFRRYMTTERRLSRHTDSNYARDLAALVKFCGRHGLEDWTALDSQHIRTFAAHSHAAGLAPRSVQRRLSAIRAFYDFLLRERLAAQSSRPQSSRPQSSRPGQKILRP